MRRPAGPLAQRRSSRTLEVQVKQRLPLRLGFTHLAHASPPRVGRTDRPARSRTRSRCADRGITSGGPTRRLARFSSRASPRRSACHCARIAAFSRRCFSVGVPSGGDDFVLFGELEHGVAAVALATTEDASMTAPAALTARERPGACCHGARRGIAYVGSPKPRGHLRPFGIPIRRRNVAPLVLPSLSFVRMSVTCSTAIRTAPSGLG